MTAPKPPPGLSTAGTSLWRRLSTAFDFAEHELALLEVTCHQADDVAALEAAIKRDGMIVAGSTGQQRLNGAVTEVRQGRLALGKLLAQLALPVDEEQAGRSPASRRAQHASNSRWSRVARMEDHRRGGTDGAA